MYLPIYLFVGLCMYASCRCGTGRSFDVKKTRLSVSGHGRLT